MTREVLILQLGMGGVGQALVRQVQAQPNRLVERYGFRLSYLGLLDSSGALFTGNPLSSDMLTAALDAKASGRGLASLEAGTAVEDWLQLLPDTPCIVVDVTAAAGMADSLIAATAAGHHVVLANKRPLTETYPLFEALTASGTTRYEATVGAGLPVVYTLHNLLDSGDEIVRVEAAMSGTLGFLCTALQEGKLLSEAVSIAYERGWTEPDPRDDLSGADVARKALIVARIAGYPWEMDAVPAAPLFPSEMNDLSVEAFLQQLTDLDQSYAAQTQQAWAEDTVLRYVASVEPAGARIELCGMASQHPLAALRGTDNLFSITTQRYAEHPLVIRGPGAGVEVTAAGVLSDIMAAAREM